jgi:hypothetical protein
MASNNDSATTVQVMWCQEHFWNASAPGIEHLSKLILQYDTVTVS